MQQCNILLLFHLATPWKYTRESLNGLKKNQQYRAINVDKKSEMRVKGQ